MKEILLKERVQFMARCKRNLSLQEQLDKITNDIEQMESALVDLKKTKCKIEEQIKQNQLEELHELILSKGMSLEKVKELLSAE